MEAGRLGFAFTNGHGIMNFSDFFIKRPIFATMIIMAMVVVGATAYTKLGVDRLPSVDLPTINIRTTLPGASPEEMETEVS